MEALYCRRFLHSVSLEMTKTLKEYVKRPRSSAISVPQRPPRWVARPCDDVHIIDGWLDSVLCGAGVSRLLQIQMERAVGSFRRGGGHHLLRPDCITCVQANGYATQAVSRPIDTRFGLSSRRTLWRKVRLHVVACRQHLRLGVVYLYDNAATLQKNRLADVHLGRGGVIQPHLHGSALPRRRNLRCCSRIDAGFWNWIFTHSHRHFERNEV